ncbi:hypothetical protein PITC_025770 [Penicillium italicum]|uniref:Uncharacterized protein n=1 Tax=Penicillium italicum TaxID=40296 RepID=A0A0A2LDS0_PENIT|nr:hypothetical protein PITC_025770 [Penicillium italicum]
MQGEHSSARNSERPIRTVGNYTRAIGLAQNNPGSSKKG